MGRCGPKRKPHQKSELTPVSPQNVWSSQGFSRITKSGELEKCQGTLVKLGVLALAVLFRVFNNRNRQSLYADRYTTDIRDDIARVSSDVERGSIHQCT